MRSLAALPLLAACPPPPIVETDAGDSDTGDSDTGDSDTADSDTADSDTADSDTDDGWIEVPFRATDLVLPPTGRYDASALYVDSDFGWTFTLNRPAPPAVAGKAHIVVYPSDQPFPGAAVRVDRIERRADTSPWRLFSTIRVPEGCETLPLPLPVAAAVEVDAVSPAPFIQVEPPTIEKVACAGSVAELGACTVTTPCASGLVCHGLTTSTLSGGVGTCRAKALSGVVRDSRAVPIPDGDAEGVLLPLTVSGLGTVTEDVVLALSLTHARPTDVVVSVINPDGTEVVVRDRQSGDNRGITRTYAVAGFPGDERANGTWQVRVTDPFAGESGTVADPALGLTTRLD